MNNTILELNNVSFEYNSNKEILRDTSVSFDQGTINGIVGLSGSGKTTLIRLINGSLIKDHQYEYQGEVLLYNKELRKHSDINRYVGTVYQDPDNQIIFTRVIDEVVFGMENHNKDYSYIHDELLRVLDLLGISHLKLRDPNQLSGGEKQLVVLASILTLDVDVIILDECMTGVSQKSRLKVLEIVKKLRNQGKCILMIEHDFENLSFADSIYEISNYTLNLTSYVDLLKDR